MKAWFAGGAGIEVDLVVDLGADARVDVGLDIGAAA
jgi:hypothetical protein